MPKFSRRLARERKKERRKERKKESNGQANEEQQEQTRKLLLLPCSSSLLQRQREQARRSIHPRPDRTILHVRTQANDEESSTGLTTKTKNRQESSTGLTTKPKNREESSTGLTTKPKNTEKSSTGLTTKTKNRVPGLTKKTKNRVPNRRRTRRRIEYGICSFDDENATAENNTRAHVVVNHLRRHWALLSVLAF
ncbi:hypothetical protein CY35_05G045800 [Sphagnum magellanicum]|nr:hypothetical protein CY35_05G045800 [Sphagnum magellanicum]